MAEMDKIVMKTLQVKSISSNDYSLYPRMFDVAHLWESEPRDPYGQVS
jgi:hypothetical protein